MTRVSRDRVRPPRGHRSERLRALGASIVVGSLTDIHDLRRAMTGVQRAYFCTPLEPGALRAAAVFAMVAAEHNLESVVAMSQWLASPHHRSPHTRETWLGTSCSRGCQVRPSPP